MVKRIMILALLILYSGAIDDTGNKVVFDSQVEYFPRDVMLRWTFPDAESVIFEFWVPIGYYEHYHWAGIAFQSPLDARDNFKCDYHIAMMDDNPQFTDRYAEHNGLAPLDTEQGGTNDITTWSEINEDYLIVYMQRDFDTGDPYDIELPYGKPVLVKWAYGYTIEGEIQQHDLRDMGFEYFILNEGYLDNNDDERTVYGPWSELHPQKQNWQDEYGSPLIAYEYPVLESTYTNTPLSH